jgi:subtilisin family serine protease
MATPHVVGAFSLLWNYRPDLSATQIKEALYSGATYLTSLDGKIAGNKKLNLYSSIKLLDITPPTIS